jgi:hypothetical protein
MCVEHRCFQVLVAEQFIIGSDIITVRKHMSGDHGAINDQVGTHRGMVMGKKENEDSGMIC